MSEHLPPLPPELEALFAEENAEKETPDMSPVSRERVYRRLESSVAALAVGAAATVAAGAVAKAGIGSAVAAAAPGKLARWLGKAAQLKATSVVVAASVGAAAGGGAVGYQVGEHVAETRQAPKPAMSAPPKPSAPPLSEAPAPPNELEFELDAAPPPPPQKPAGTTSASAPSDDGRLAEEIALVQMARTALVRGDAAGAFDACEKHRRKFSNGKMTEERESVAIQALARLGRLDEARARAAAFEQKYPSSLALPVIRAALSGP